MSKKDYVPPAVIAKARKIDLLTFFRTYYPQELVKEGNTQYCTKTHDSLKMSNGVWNWYSRGIGGKNAMQFFEKTQGIKFPESAAIIADKMKIRLPIFEEKQEKRNSVKLILPEKNNNADRVKKYLTSRGIDKEIIENCIEKHLIYEEKQYHNVVFVGYDEGGKAKYAGCRAINKSKFKNDATGSNKVYSFRLESKEKTDTIYIFEGAIDLLSYATLFKLYGIEWQDKTLISLAGVYQTAKILERSKVPLAIENYLQKHPETKKIYLCLDSDEAGKNASKALKTVLSDRYEVIIKPPKKRKGL